MAAKTPHTTTKAAATTKKADKKAKKSAELTEKKPKKTAGKKATKKADRTPLRSAPPLGISSREALVVPQPPLGHGQHRDMGVIAGTEGPTACLDAGATDLCEIAPSGLVAVAGDTWKGPRAWVGEWSPSLALHVNSLAGRVTFDRSFGWRNLYQEGWAPGGSQLPAGTVRVRGVDYLMVTRTVDLVPQDSRLVVINPDRPGWATVPGSQRPAAYQGFNQTQISGCEAPDGWVYIVADDFHRRNPVVLYRCRPETFTDRDSWAGWGKVNGDPNRWDWGQPPCPLHPDLFGELSLRWIEGKFVLSAFNETARRIEVHVADRVEQILRPVPPVPPCTIVAHAGELPNLYGGYIVPGSTLDRTRILVSQWAQWGAKDDPYNVREFEVNLNR